MLCLGAAMAGKAIVLREHTRAAAGACELDGAASAGYSEVLLLGPLLVLIYCNARQCMIYFAVRIHL